MENQYTDIFASATTKDAPVVGVPGFAIPQKKTPGLKAFDTMEKRKYDTSYYLEEIAAQDDVFSILTEISSACMIGLWTLSAPDPEASADSMKEIKLWIKETSLIKAFTGAAINDDNLGAFHNWHTHGKMAIYILRDGKAGSGKVTKFHNLPVDGLVRMTDPRNPLNYYFYQKMKVVSDYTNPAAFDDVNDVSDTPNISSTEQKIWYIEGGEGQRDATGEDGQKLYPKIEAKDWVNDRENLYFIRNPHAPLNDEIITTIMNKRYLMRMSIIATQLGLAPFDKLTFGSEEFPPVPAPDVNIQTTNPVLYAKQASAYNQYKSAMATTLDNLFDATTNGKPFGTHPGIEHVRHEPKMALTAEFVDKMLGIYNDVIARSTGIPRSMIESMGTELATSRLTKSIVDIALSAHQQEFNEFITTLIKIQFEQAFDNDGIEVVLQPLDKADAQTQAQIELLVAQATETLARAGASPETLQKYVLGSEDLPLREVEFAAPETNEPVEKEVVEKEPPTTRVIK